MESLSTNIIKPTTENLPKQIFYLLVFAIFSRELFQINLPGDIGYDLFSYNFFVITFLYLFLTNKIGYNVKWVVGLFAFILLNISLKMYHSLPMIYFFKQIIPIIIIYTVTFWILKRCDIVKVFNIYINFCFYAAIFGIFQFFMNQVGVDILIKVDNRLDSIIYEPSHYANIVVPAFVYLLLKSKRLTIRIFVLGLSLFLTFSTSIFAVILIIFVILNMKSYMFPIVLFISISLAGLGIMYDPETLDKMIPFYDYAVNPEVRKTFYTYAHGTAISLLTNLEVAIYSLSENPLFGSGLGGHQARYFEYYAGSSFAEKSWHYGWNSSTGHSLIIRLLSEVGLAGVLFIIYRIKKLLILDKKTGKYYFISIACLSYFLFRLFKLGGYFEYGIYFFVVIFMLNYGQYKKARITSN